jgi:hypothetical protein
MENSAVKIENVMLKKVNEIARNETFTAIKKVNKGNNRRVQLVMAGDEFNVWISPTTYKFFTDDNNGTWYSFK